MILGSVLQQKDISFSAFFGQQSGHQGLVSEENLEPYRAPMMYLFCEQLNNYFQVLEQQVLEQLFFYFLITFCQFCAKNFRAQHYMITSILTLR